jgi:predicted PurR-regulated permease PerM
VTTPPRRWSDVPWRSIVAAVLVVLATVIVVDLVMLAERVLLLVVLAGFMAVVLAPLVRQMQARLHARRGLAVGVVMITTVVVVTGMLTVFIWPVRAQLGAVITDLPGAVQDAQKGRGPLGELVSRLRLEQLVEQNQESLTRAAESMQRSLPDLISEAVTLTLDVVTILVVCSLMLMQSAALARSALRILPVRHRETVTEVSRSAASAVSGYMIGNLVISVCAGVAALLFCLVTGVPNPLLLALWVAFADLIPLVGATLGAVVVIIAALFVSPTVGIIAVVFFALYQQFENSVLQVVVMARTVKVNPLTVLLSVLLGVDLFGFVGALLAVPVAGVISVVAHEIWRHRNDPQEGLVIVGEYGTVTDTDGKVIDLSNLRTSPDVPAQDDPT